MLGIGKKTSFWLSLSVTTRLVPYRSLGHASSWLRGAGGGFWEGGKEALPRPKPAILLS